MNTDFLQIMVQECYARNGFCVKLRSDRTWDKVAFARLAEAMRLCCKQYEISAEGKKQLEERCLQMTKEDIEELADHPITVTQRMLPDDLALMFWFFPHFVRDWTSHEVWEDDRAREPDYFEKAYQLLDDLASWFFFGRCPWSNEEEGWNSTFLLTS
jgi:hypothetical protein